MDWDAIKFSVVCTSMLAVVMLLFFGTINYYAHDGSMMIDINKDLKIQYFCEVNNSMTGQEKMELIQSLCNETYDINYYNQIRAPWMWSHEDILDKCVCELAGIE